MPENEDYKNYIKFKGWDALFFYDNNQSKQFADILKSLPINQKSVLEIGFGSGSLMSWMRDQGAEVTGIEIQSELVESAKDNGFKSFSSLDNIKDRSFDIVIGLDVFEHIERSQLNLYLTNISRILKPGGYLIARFPNCQSPNGVFTQYGDATHLSALSVPIFEHHANMSNLKLVNSKEGKAIEFYSENFLKKFFKKLIRESLKRLISVALSAGPTPLWADVIVTLKKV